MPFLCTPQTTHVNGTLQITDLFPNKSQFNPTLLPQAQGPRMINTPSASDLSQTPVLNGDFVVQANVSGLSAYLLATVEVSSDVNNIGLTAVQSDNISDAIISAMRAGGALTSSAINALINAETGGGGADGIGLGNTTATVLNILQILSGARVFTLPANTDLGDENNAGEFIPVAGNALTAMFTTPVGYKEILSADSSFFISCRQGQISKAVGASLLLAYNDDGSLIQ